jgi:hypothetical protein
MARRARVIWKFRTRDGTAEADMLSDLGAAWVEWRATDTYEGMVAPAELRSGKEITRGDARRIAAEHGLDLIEY